MRVLNVILSGIGQEVQTGKENHAVSKQYLPVFNGRSLFELTFERNRKFTDIPMVIGRVDNFRLSRKAFSNLGVLKYNEIIEASDRKNAADLAFAAFASDPDDILVINPSDLMVKPSISYQESVKEAISMAESGKIVVIGLYQSSYDTGFGYVIHDRESVRFSKQINFEISNYLLDPGSLLIHSGIYCFQAKVFLKELKKYQPEFYSRVKRAYFKKSGSFINELLNEAIPEIDLEEDLLQNTCRLKVLPAHFDVLEKSYQSDPTLKPVLSPSA